jgi:hypothetical protein
VSLGHALLFLGEEQGADPTTCGREQKRRCHGPATCGSAHVFVVSTSVHTGALRSKQKQKGSPPGRSETSSLAVRGPNTHPGPPDTNRGARTVPRKFQLLRHCASTMRPAAPINVSSIEELKADGTRSLLSSLLTDDQPRAESAESDFPVGEKLAAMRIAVFLLRSTGRGSAGCRSHFRRRYADGGPRNHQSGTGGSQKSCGGHGSFRHQVSGASRSTQHLSRGYRGRPM